MTDFQSRRAIHRLNTQYSPPQQSDFTYIDKDMPQYYLDDDNANDDSSQIETKDDIAIDSDDVDSSLIDDIHSTLDTYFIEEENDDEEIIDGDEEDSVNDNDVEREEDDEDLGQDQDESTLLKRRDVDDVISADDVQTQQIEPTLQGTSTSKRKNNTRIQTSPVRRGFDIEKLEFTNTAFDYHDKIITRSQPIVDKDGNRVGEEKIDHKTYVRVETIPHVILDGIVHELSHYDPHTDLSKQSATRIINAWLLASLDISLDGLDHDTDILRQRFCDLMDAKKGYGQALKKEVRSLHENLEATQDRIKRLSRDLSENIDISSEILIASIINLTNAYGRLPVDQARRAVDDINFDHKIIHDFGRKLHTHTEKVIEYQRRSQGRPRRQQRNKKGTLS